MNMTLSDAPILIAKKPGQELEIMKSAFKKAGLENPIEVVAPNQIKSYLTQHSRRGSSNFPLLCMVEASTTAVLERIKSIPLFLKLPIIVLGSTRENKLTPMSPSMTYWSKPHSLDEWVQRLIPLKRLIHHLECTLPV